VHDDLRAWDEVAETYAATPQIDWFDGFFGRHLPHDLTGRRVLDLGCGHGWFAGELHRRGADVHALDGSRALLAIAERDHPGPRYEHFDLTTADLIGTYDVVVALMVLMDVPTLDRIRPTIAPGGTLVATILHPSFWNQRTVDDATIGNGGYRRVTGYLEHETWRVESFGSGGHNHYHRPLGDYVAWIAGLGLGVIELFEPPSAGYGGWRRAIPTRLGIAARPTATP
jgi:2-polyprenyl-3-methyl-5-hydroxy-6-metoxy-1,4-benzoquinol methylase